MRIAKIIMAAAFAVAMYSAVEVVSPSTAAAKAHVTKGKPGKCGTFKYYSKKDKGCVDKRG
jgi:hypothetical protein